MSPEETVLLTNVLMGSGVLFLIAYLGNVLTFSNRFLNALATALIFGVFYGALIYTVEKNFQAWFQIIVMASSVVFVLDLVANFISFRNRAVSALVTAVLFAVLFGVAAYSTGALSTTNTSPTSQSVIPKTTP